MEVGVTDNPGLERYEISEAGDLAGFAQYRLQPGLIAFVHTEVDPRFEGRGLGTRLIVFALEDARTRGLGVLPFCPFFKAYLRDHPEQVDLVPEDRREKFGL